MAKLTITYDDENIKEVSLSRGSITIGRKPGNDIKINMKEVSSTHAKLFNYGGHYFIQDLDSLNGTFVNGAKIKTHHLKHGDKIVIGYHTLIFTIEPQDEAVQCEVKQLPTGETVLVGKSAKESPTQPTHLQNKQSQAQAHLTVVSGASDKNEYILKDELTVIGKKSDAQIKLKNLLAPKIAAEILKKSNGYYITVPKKKLVKINNIPLEEEHKLKDGDVIDTGSLTLKFKLKAQQKQ
jgi:predicted component of type VI protein secretion system